MEDKINIAELLKDCPKGTELYSPLCGRCVFDRLNMGTIICKKQNTQEITFTSEGYYMLPAFNDCECVLFPSKDQRDWSKFQRPFKDGDIVALGYGDGAQLFIFKEYIHHDYAKCYMMLDKDGTIDLECNDYHVSRLATEEEKQKLFDAIKANGYKWNAITKTLEKLIEPKFKIGDRVRLKLKHDYVYTIYSLTWDDNKQLAYRFLPNNDKHLILVSLNKQDNYELVPDKFNISDLKPFDKVLVRQNISWKWGIDFFDFYDGRFYHATGGCMYAQCIPYEGNEHLRGKTDDCDDFYKTWK